MGGIEVDGEWEEGSWGQVRSRAGSGIRVYCGEEGWGGRSGRT